MNLVSRLGKNIIKIKGRQHGGLVFERYCASRSILR